MSVLTRTAFFASLTFVLSQLALPGQARTGDVGDGGAAEAVQVHDAPHPAPHGARTRLPDAPADRIAEPPFAHAQPAYDAVSRVNVLAPETGWFGIARDAQVTLPPSRAPPALS